MFAQSRDVMGLFGSERIKTLKQAFRTIIDNALPLELRSILGVFNEVKPSKLIKLMKDANKYNTTYKFMKESTETTVNDIFRQVNFSKSLLEQWAINEVGFTNILNSVKHCILDLVKLRNKLFMILKEGHNFHFESGIYKG